MTDGYTVAAPDFGADPTFRQLLPGDRFPSLRQECCGRPGFVFDTIAGRYQLYAFFLSGDDAEIREAVAAVTARRDLFDDERAAFTGVSVSARDRQWAGFSDALPGVRFAWDLDRSMSQACGAVPLNAAPDAGIVVERRWILVDPSLHVLQIWPMRGTPVSEVIEALERLPPPDRFGGIARTPPVLLLPNVLEPELCRRLIELYDREGGQESGVFRRDGHVVDHTFKRRKDVTVSDPELIRTLNQRIVRRVRPELARLFFMQCDYIERHIVGCYSAADGGHFAAHTDNGAGLTAHRRFAVSINLCTISRAGRSSSPSTAPRATRRRPAGRWSSPAPSSTPCGR